ncbi:unnamed protein product [Trichogramma brassicae]|uniref:Uncharacterized protein n=1 Tax=Trichogramma brassicae TaxID=86971 RepID=A0A6H5I150_9HYME|nr:unnamed protein product [Trichogramma brassicae]
MAGQATMRMKNDLVITLVIERYGSMGHDLNPARSYCQWEKRKLPQITRPRQVRTIICPSGSGQRYSATADYVFGVGRPNWCSKQRAPAATVIIQRKSAASPGYKRATKGKRKRIVYNDHDEHYGDSHQEPDMEPQDFDKLVEEHLGRLQVDQRDRLGVEKRTREQRMYCWPSQSNNHHYKLLGVFKMLRISMSSPRRKDVVDDSTESKPRVRIGAMRLMRGVEGVVTDSRHAAGRSGRDFGSDRHREKIESEAARASVFNWHLLRVYESDSSACIVLPDETRRASYWYIERSCVVGRQREKLSTSEKDACYTVGH